MAKDEIGGVSVINAEFPKIDMPPVQWDGGFIA